MDTARARHGSRERGFSWWARITEVVCGMLLRHIAWYAAVGWVAFVGRYTFI